MAEASLQMTSLRALTSHTSDRIAAPSAPARTAGNRAWWAALALLCVALTAPLLVVDVPPLLDYPNHLARVFVLASLPRDTILARFYAPHWSIIPNLALDLIAPPLLHLLPIHVVGRLLIAIAVLLPVLGSVAYNTALGGRWWSFGAGLVAYNSCLLYGFLNFAISLGLALLLAAAWLRWREDRPWRAVIVAIIGAPSLFFCHLMGLAFFGLLIGGAELFRLYQARNDNPLRAVLTRGSILLLIFAAPAALYTLAPLRSLGGDAQFMPPADKLLQLLTTFVNYVWPLDMATACIVFALPALCLLLRWGRVPGPAACATALLLIAFLASPFAWKGTYFLDTRFAVMFGFMVFAGFVPTRMPFRFRCIAAAALVLLFTARMAVLTTAWAERREDLADLRRTLAPVRPGQAVFAAAAGIAEAPAYWHTNPGWRRLSNGMRTDKHLGALALIEHRAFWPYEFDRPSQQPMTTREPYRTMVAELGDLPNRAATAATDVCGFDYVLLLEADAVPRLPEDRFRLLVQSGFAALYAITRCKPDP